MMSTTSDHAMDAVLEVVRDQPEMTTRISGMPCPGWDVPG